MPLSQRPPTGSYPSVTSCFFAVAALIVGGFSASAEEPLSSPRLQVERLTADSWLLHWPAFPSPAQLEFSPSLGTGSPWQSAPLPTQIQNDRVTALLQPGSETGFFRLRLLESPPLTTLTEVSPFPSEGSVSVHREVILRFSRPLSPVIAPTSEDLVVSFAGRPWLSRLHLSTDRQSLTWFPLEPLPAGARVRVQFSGDHLRDDLNRPLDADGDGQAGGRLEFEFVTTGIAPIPGTAIVGQVFATDPLDDDSAGFTHRPLSGVTITVDGAEETLRTLTDAEGRFRLDPAPAGRFFVHIDGRTSPDSDWPGGAYYPFIGKAWEAEAGRTNNLAGGSGEIYLPRIAANALQPVSATETTVISFPQETLDRHPELAGVELAVPPNALFSDDGTRGGRIGMAPVPPDRLPDPLPPGLEFPLVITVQTDGPQNFDGPVPVRFPNLPDPVTGDTLGPGETTALWSFNHDTGRWEIQGTMTISDDGAFAVSDPGVGIRQPGWHGVRLGAMFDRIRLNSSCLKDAGCRMALITGGMDLLWSAMPIPNAKRSAECLAGTLTWSGFRTPLDCIAGDGLDCTMSVLGATGSALLCVSHSVPYLRTLHTAASIVSSVGSSCVSCYLPPDPAAARSALLGHRLAAIPNAANLSLQGEIELIALGRLLAAWTEVLHLHYGSDAWSSIAQRSPSEPWVASALAGDILNALGQAQQASSEDGPLLSPNEAALILALPRPDALDVATLETAIARVNRTRELHAQEIFTHAQAGRSDFADRGELLLAFAELDAAAADLQRLAVPSLDPAGIMQRHLDAQSAHWGTALPANDLTRVFYVIEELPDGLVIRGRLGADGRVNLAAVRPNTAYRATFYDPRDQLWGKVTFSAASVGRLTPIPLPLLIPIDQEADADEDGLPDIAEWVVGTFPNNPDSDGDGLLDGTELRQGSNPLDQRPAHIGVVASVPTPTPALSVATDRGLAVTTHGPSGITLFDVSNPHTPARVAQIATPGQALAVALSGRWAAVASGTAGLSLVSLANPPTAGIQFQIDLGGQAQAVSADLTHAYVGLASGDLVPVELATGTVGLRTNLTTSIDDLAHAGDHLVALTRTSLVILRPSPDGFQTLGSLPVSGQPSPLEVGRKLFVGGDLAYIGFFTGFSVVDLSDPSSPQLLGAPSSTGGAMHDLVANGSGLLLGTTSFSGTSTLALSLYDVSNPSQVDQFLLSLDTPGTPRALALDRGLAFVADGARGLQVVNYQTADARGLPPSLSMTTGLPVIDGLPTVQEGLPTRITVLATDDVEVRQVDLFLDQELFLTDGNFPFDFRFHAPFLPDQRTTFQLQARATDTGGRNAWSERLTIRTTPDTNPPRVVAVSPRPGARVGRLDAIRIEFTKPLDPLSLTENTLRLVEAGPDGAFDTPDDQPIPNLSFDFQSQTRLLSLTAGPILPIGQLRLTLTDDARDLRGNRLASPLIATFLSADFIDGDADGLPDLLEAALGLDANRPDSNDDGVWDGDEDFNRSGRSNAEEYFAGKPMTPVLVSGTQSLVTVSNQHPGRLEFVAREGAHLVLRLSANGFSPRLQLFDPLGILVANSAATTGSARDVEVTHTTTIPGTYRVLVTSYFANGTGTALVSLADPLGPVVVGPDDQGGPLVSGAQHHGSLPVGDLDVWTFDAPPNHTVFLRAGTANARPLLRLFGPEGALVTSANGPYTSSRDARILFRTVTGGRHSLVLSANALNTAATYTLHFLLVPGAEVTSPEDQGGPVASGETRPGSLTLGDLDAWTLDAAVGDTLAFRVGTTGFNPRLHLLGPAGEELASATGTYSSSRDARIEFRTATSGRHTVVLSANAEGESGNYNFHAVRIPAPVTISPDDQGGPLLPGAVHPALLPLGDLDLWTIDASPGDTLVLRAGTTGFNPRLRLYAPDGSLIDRTTGPYTSSRDATLTHRATTAGVHTVLLDANAIDDSGTYQLHAARIPGPFIVSPEDQGGALVNGAHHAGSIPLGDLDLWTIDASPGDTLVLRTGTTGFNPRLRLFGPDGTLIDSANGIYTSSRDATLTHRAITAGIHTVLLDANAIDDSGTYELHLAHIPGALTLSPGDDGGPLSVDTPQAATLSLGDVDLWTLTALPGDRLHLVADTTGFNPQLRLYGPDGSLVASAQGPFTSSRMATVTHTASASGTYTLVIQAHALDQSGTYNLLFSQPANP